MSKSALVVVTIVSTHTHIDWEKQTSAMYSTGGYRANEVVLITTEKRIQ